MVTRNRIQDFLEYGHDNHVVFLEYQHVGENEVYNYC